MFRYTKATAVREVVVWIVTLAMLLPFYILIVTSLKSDQEALTTSAVAPPSSLDFSAFVEVLTTTGRKSKRRQVLPLIYGKTPTGYAIVASKGGAPEHPAWFLNLRDDPNVDVQVAADKFSASARVATGAERTAIWKQMAALFPNYDEYQRKTTREIPVVVLERR